MKIRLKPSEEVALWLDVAGHASGALLCIIVPVAVVAALYLVLRFTR